MQIINKKTFEEIKQLFVNNGIDLSDDDIALYSNVFEVISQFVHNKLTNQEIFTVYDLLSDVIKNNRPDIAPYVSKDERIRVQVNLMENLAETKGKLTLEEKIALAFCVYTGECVQLYDEESKTMCNGIVLFDSFEHIKNELEYEQKQFPSRYKIEKRKITFDKTYGYTKDNPINTTSIDESYLYLNSLKYKGSPIIYERIGSLSNSKDEIIDKYDIFAEKKLFLRKKIIKVATIYINPYCDEMPKIAPTGFSLM